MKALSSMTIFLSSSSRRLFTRATPLPPFNSESETLLGISQFSTLSSSFHSSSRRNSEDIRNVGVFVWWNFHSCSVPRNANVYRVIQRITAAVRANGIEGPIDINAFGNMDRLSRFNQDVLYSAGINATHVVKNSYVDGDLFDDLCNWVWDNPPPAHLFLISDDKGLAHYLHIYRMKNYNILLASTENAPQLCSAATIMWHWTDLVKGENLSGKHFNQPPDDPFDSWYGHYNVPLEDPFVVSNQCSCLQSVEEMPEMFAESFWNDMLAFLETPKGSVTILQSKTRQELVENLQRLGPSRLQSLSERHMLHLVDLLVSEKKWVVECPSQTSPFGLV